METGSRVTSNEQPPPLVVGNRSASVIVPSVEGNGAMTRVWCPSEPDVSTDVLLISLQDLDLLLSSLCVVQPQALGR
jgi:hypothetical protein